MTVNTIFRLSDPSSFRIFRITVSVLGVISTKCWYTIAVTIIKKLSVYSNNLCSFKISGLKNTHVRRWQFTPFSMMPSLFEHLFNLYYVEKIYYQNALQTPTPNAEFTRRPYSVHAALLKTQQRCHSVQSNTLWKRQVAALVLSMLNINAAAWRKDATLVWQGFKIWR